jgi:hypothetical protein
MTALRTLLRGISGIDIYNADAFGSSFVYEKLFQLIERPTVKLSSLIFSMSTPLTNVLEILKYYSRSCRKTLNYLLRYTMVLIPTKTVLLLRGAHKVSFRGFRSTRLETTSPPLISIRDSLDSSSSKKYFITSNSDTSDTSVDPDEGIRRDLIIRDYLFKHESKEYFSFIINQLGGFSFPIQKLFKILIGLKLESFSSMYSKDGDFIFIEPNIIGVSV